VNRLLDVGDLEVRSRHRHVTYGGVEVALAEHPQHDPQGVAATGDGVHEPRGGLVDGAEVKVGNDEFWVLLAVGQRAEVDGLEQVVLCSLKIVGKEVELAEQVVALESFDMAFAVDPLAHFLPALDERHRGFDLAHAEVDLGELLVEEAELLAHDCQVRGGVVYGLVVLLDGLLDPLHLQECVGLVDQLLEVADGQRDCFDGGPQFLDVLGLENEALPREVVQPLDADPSADAQIPQGRVLAVLVLQAAQETDLLLGEGY
jgi:hypothetical protein